MSAFARELEAMAEAEADDVRYRARQATTVDEYLDALREAGSLGAGIRATSNYVPPLEDRAVIHDEIAEDAMTRAPKEKTP